MKKVLIKMYLMYFIAISNCFKQSRMKDFDPEFGIEITNTNNKEYK